LEGFHSAAELYRACRAGGEAVRELSDCLVAIPTIEANATLLQADPDFEILARHTPLRLEPVS
jgi:predicted nucleic acid-binding protein